MSDVLSRAETALARIQKSGASQSVVYQRLGATVTVTATVGRSMASQYDQGGMVIAYETTDFLILATDLVLNGKQVVPMRGDEVLWRNRVYRVVSEQQGEKPWRESGPDGTVIRVMTKVAR